MGNLIDLAEERRKRRPVEERKAAPPYDQETGVVDRKVTVNGRQLVFDENTSTFREPEGEPRA